MYPKNRGEQLTCLCCVCRWAGLEVAGKLAASAVGINSDGIGRGGPESRRKCMAVGTTYQGKSEWSDDRSGVRSHGREVSWVTPGFLVCLNGQPDDSCSWGHLPIASP